LALSSFFPSEVTGGPLSSFEPNAMAPDWDDLRLTLSEERRLLEAMAAEGAREELDLKAAHAIVKGSLYIIDI
jgi:hypothetical protein